MTVYFYGRNSDSESFDERVEGVGTIKPQQACKRFPEAFQAAYEDPPQISLLISAVPANQSVEFLRRLSAMRRAFSLHFL